VIIERRKVRPQAALQKTGAAEFESLSPPFSRQVLRPQLGAASRHHSGRGLLDQLHL